MIKIPLRFKKKKEGPKKIRKRAKKNPFQKVPRRWRLLLWILPIIILLWGYIYKNILTNPDHIVKNVIISEESKAVYDSKEIENWIISYFSWVNFQTYSYTKQWEFNTYIKKEFPIIDTITISKTDKKNTIFSSIQYHIPEFILWNKNNQRVVRQNKAYPILAADSIKEWLMQLRLPADSDELTNLDGLFYHIHSDTLLKIINNITDIVEWKDISDIEYIPWWQKLHITYKWKLILFHLDKSLDSQLAKLLDLKQYYSDFNAVSRLDLWSNNDIIVK